jgi:peptidoglycan hydrolase CwlO-like protein
MKKPLLSVCVGLLVSVCLLATSYAQPVNVSQITQSNSQVEQLQHGLEAMNATVDTLGKKLAESPSDLALAAKYYQAYHLLVATLLDMHHDFLKKAESDYPLFFIQEKKKIEKLISDTEDLIKTLPGKKNAEQERAHLWETQGQLKAIFRALEKAERRLADQVDWAEQNRDWLEVRRKVLTSRIETLQIARDSKGTLDDIGRDFTGLDYDLPPMINFELPSVFN